MGAGMQARLPVSLANCAKVHRLPSRSLRACDMARRRWCMAAWCVARWPQNPSSLLRNDSFRSRWHGANAMLRISGAGAAILAPRNLGPGGAAGYVAGGYFYGCPASLCAHRLIASLYHYAFWVVFRERFFGTNKRPRTRCPHPLQFGSCKVLPFPFEALLVCLKVRDAGLDLLAL